MRERTYILQNLDWITILLYLLLVLTGWLSIYAAVYNESHTSIVDLDMNYGKQLVWILTSVVLAIAILVIDAKFYSTFSMVIYFLVIGMLVAVLVFGKEIAGSKSWFEVGSFSLQPSEFAKVAVALAIAKYLSGLDVDISKFRTKLTVALLMFMPAMLILLQPDTGSALVFTSFVLVMYREGMPGTMLIVGVVAAVLFILSLLFNKFLIIGLLVMNAALVFYLYPTLRKKWFRVVVVFLVTSAFVFSVDYAFENVLEPHQKKRINVLLGIETDIQGAGYNVHQSKIAIGSGGFTGKGFLKGTQTKFDFVPEQSTDFIFCTIGEEWGFIGSLTVILLFVGLMGRLVILAERQRSKFSRIYGYGVASVLFFHFTVNIGMTIGLFPVIGIPLPYISYGGSSLWGFTILLFIFLKLDSVRLDLL
jgi:rod shape determining protein RodA